MKSAGTISASSGAAVDRLEHEAGLGPGTLRDAEILERHRGRQRLEVAIGLVGEAQPRQRPLRVLDEEAVELEARAAAGIEVEHGAEVLFELVARLTVVGTGIEALPVRLHPRDDEVVVGLGRDAAEHHVDLERLVGRHRIVDGLLDLALEPEDEARAEHALERVRDRPPARDACRRSRWLSPKLSPTGTGSPRWS